MVVETNESRIGRAVAALAKRPHWSQPELHRLLLDICDTKKQATALSNRLQILGYLERRVIVLDRTRARAQKWEGAEA